MTFSGPNLIKVTPLRQEFNTQREASMKLLIFYANKNKLLFSQEEASMHIVVKT
jgi:hypothetical protein